LRHGVVFEPNFFTNGAIKSVTLLAHAVFASVNSSSRPSEVRSRTHQSLTNHATLLPHHLELTTTAIKTGAIAIWINQGH